MRRRKLTVEEPTKTGVVFAVSEVREMLATTVTRWYNWHEKLARILIQVLSVTALRETTGKKVSEQRQKPTNESRKRSGQAAQACT